MNYQRSLFLAFIFLIQTDPLALGQIDCLNNGNYTSNSTYSVNLNTTLSSLYTNVDSNGFYSASAGQGMDRANAMVLCRGDLQLNMCRECIQEASAALLKSCRNQKQAVRTNDEHCMLRYSNETIYGTLATSPRYWLWNTRNATGADQFMEDLRTLVDDLRNKAAFGGSLRKVAAGNVTGPDFQTIFGLVQCTPDLSPEDCTSCLIQAAADIPRCCDRRTGGRVLMPSCNLRFEIFPFVNETRLQELEPASVPAVEPPLHSSRGKGNGDTTRTIVIVVVSVVVCLMLT